MKNFRRRVHVDEGAFEQASNRDRSLINIYALFVPVSAVIAGFAIYFSINYLIGAWLVSIVFAGLALVAFFQHDSTLLEEMKKGVIYARIVVSVVLMVVLLVPAKIKIIGEDKIIDEVVWIANQTNTGIEREFLSAKNAIETKEQELQANVTAAGRAYDKTKKVQALVESRRELAAYQAKKADLIAEQRAYFDEKKVTPKTTRVDIASYYFLNMFSSNNPAETFINLVILILALIFETLPVFMIVALNNGKYMELREESRAFAEKARANKRKIKSRMLTEDGLENVTELIEEHSVWSDIEELNKTGFGDVEKLREMSKRVREMKSRKEKAQQPLPVQETSSNGQPQEPEIVVEDYADFDYDS